MSPTVGQVALLIYGALLGVGGYIGYAKAGSRASLIAGVAGTVLALTAVVISAFQPWTGFLIGLILAMVFSLFFLYRLASSRKLMPSGLLAATSLVVTVVLILVMRPD